MLTRAFRTCQNSDARKQHASWARIAEISTTLRFWGAPKPRSYILGILQVWTSQFRKKLCWSCLTNSMAWLRVTIAGFRGSCQEGRGSYRRLHWFHSLVSSCSCELLTLSNRNPLLLSSLDCPRIIRRSPLEKMMLLAVFLVSSCLLTVEENLLLLGWKMRCEYSERRFQCPRYHFVWLWELIFIHAVSKETIPPVNKRNSLFREAEGGARSSGVMQETGHSYSVDVLSPRKCQAKNSAPASNHEAYPCPLLRVVPAYPTSKRWVVTPTISVGGRCALRRILE